MKKWLSLLLTLSLLLGACGAMAEVTQEEIDAKYDPAIELTAWRVRSSAIQFENGDTIEDHVYIDRYLSDLGIKLTYDWVVAEEQFDQKMNVSIASGDLPDLMWLKSAQLKELAQEFGAQEEYRNLFKQAKLGQEYQKQLGSEVVRLTLMLGLKLEEPVLRSAVEKLSGQELMGLRDALRERAAEHYPVQLQLGTVKGEEALESGYLI